MKLLSVLLLSLFMVACASNEKVSVPEVTAETVETEVIKQREVGVGDLPVASTTISAEKATDLSPAAIQSAYDVTEADLAKQCASTKTEDKNTFNALSVYKGNVKTVVADGSMAGLYKVDNQFMSYVPDEKRGWLSVGIAEAQEKGYKAKVSALGTCSTYKKLNQLLLSSVT